MTVCVLFVFSCRVGALTGCCFFQPCFCRTPRWGHTCLYVCYLFPVEKWDEAKTVIGSNLFFLFPFVFFFVVFSIKTSCRAMLYRLFFALHSTLVSPFCAYTPYWDNINRPYPTSCYFRLSPLELVWLSQGCTHYTWCEASSIVEFFFFFSEIV